jgi:hypothetical protein
MDDDFLGSNYVDDLVDVVQLEKRAAAGRAIDENKFVEESSPQKPSWSSRYSVDRTTLAMSGGFRRKDILDDMDREKMSAQNMFASTAYNMKSTMAEGKARVFGDGFTFRQNHVYGSQEDNLRTTWKDIDGGSSLPPAPPIHKTWQEVMKKTKRRRALMVSCLLCIGILVILVLQSALPTRMETDTQSKQQAKEWVVALLSTSRRMFHIPKAERTNCGQRFENAP